MQAIDRVVEKMRVCKRNGRHYVVVTLDIPNAFNTIPRFHLTMDSRDSESIEQNGFARNI